jgi:hypothetical protein
MVMNVDGSGQRMLDSSARYIRWSPASTRILYQGHGSQTSEPITIVNADGSGRHQVAPAGRSPVWSSDGTWIVYLPDPYRTDHGRLTLVRPDRSGARTVAAQASSARLFQLGAASVDAAQVRADLICAGCETGDPPWDAGRTLIDTTTGWVTPLTADQDWADTLLWTADGRTLLRVATSDSANGVPATFALELRTADGTLLAGQAEPAAVGHGYLMSYVPGTA